MQLEDTCGGPPYHRQPLTAPAYLLSPEHNLCLPRTTLYHIPDVELHADFTMQIALFTQQFARTRDGAQTVMNGYFARDVLVCIKLWGGAGRNNPRRARARGGTVHM
jgi:hypothetical protein